MKFYPYKKVLVILKGAHKKFWGSFYAVAWSFSHIEGGGGTKSFHSIKGGGGGGWHKRFYPVLKGGGDQKVSVLQFSHFVATPLPVSNDQSLKFFRYCSIFNKPMYKCVFLVMFRPPPPPLYAFVCISVNPPTPPLGAYVINGRPPVAKIKLFHGKTYEADIKFSKTVTCVIYSD